MFPPNRFAARTGSEDCRSARQGEVAWLAVVIVGGLLGRRTLGATGLERRETARHLDVCRQLPLTSGWLRPAAVEEELTDPTARQGVNDEDRATGMRQSADERLAYRPAELAALVGLSTKAIYRAIERGELQAARVANGSRLLVPAAATGSGWNPIRRHLDAPGSLVGGFSREMWPTPSGGPRSARGRFTREVGSSGR
jgi:excisionase family DNA binding protein